MTFKELAQQTEDTIQGREVRVKLLSGEAEPSAREELGWKGRQDEGWEKQQRVGRMEQGAGKPTPPCNAERVTSDFSV